MPALKLSKFTEREIQTLFKTARRLFKNESCTMLAAPSTLPHGRVLIVVPKAVGSAPVRNLIKRRVRVAFRGSGLQESPYNFAILTRKPIAKEPLESFISIFAVCRKRLASQEAVSTPNELLPATR